MKTAVSFRLRVSLRVIWVLSLMFAALLPQSAIGQSSSATTTTVAPSAGTITLGDTVTLTAIVSTSGGGTPTGQVTFFDGPTPIGTGPVLTLDVNSAASFTTSLLSAAASPHSITAVYHGDLTFSPSTSSAISVTVQLRTSATGVVLNPTTAVVGQPGTATVTLTDSGSVPPGTADTFAATGAPATGRTAFAATLYADGLVLVAGGKDATGTVLNSAEIYNFAGAGFTATGNLNTARTGAVAVLLPNGKVLIVGGSSDGTANGALNTAELFDPNTGTFVPTTNHMNAARFGTQAILLNNGKVLLAGGENSGGVLNSAELYDPAADTFTATGNLSAARTGAAVTLLGTGKVLIAGGSSDGTANGALNSAELFDPNGNGGAGTFTAITGANSTLTIGRWQGEAAFLLSGKVLIAGGQNSGGALPSADLYDPVANTFTPSNHSMSRARSNGSAIGLPDGMVLLAGGTTSQAVDLYDADNDIFDTTGSLQQSDNGLVGILLNNGQVLVVGLTSGGTPASDAELYSPSFNPLGTVAVTSSEAADSILGACVLTPSSSTASNCTSTITPSNPPTSPHTITGTYSADAIHSGSSNTALLTVNKASSTTAVTSSANPAVLGQSVTFTATVSAVAPGSGTATGTVVFLDGGSPIGFGTLSGGVASFSTSALTLGNHPITTSYGGDANFNASTGSLTGNPQVVNKANSATAVTSSLNPSIVGQSVTFTATVSAVAPGAGTPSGSVTFLDGGISIGTGTLSSGVATLNTSALALGNHTITTTYGGDGNFNSSTGSLTGNPQVVNKPSTTTSVTSSVNPSVFGQSVTFTATVSVVAPGVGTATGTVTFFDGGTSIGTGSLSGGVATLTTSALTGGNHTITTNYPGDANFSGSAGSLTGNPQVVNKADSTMAVTSSLNPSVFGQSITFTATVSAVAPGAGTATGTVTFLSGGSSIGTGTLSGGVATLITSTVTVGIHTITASYGGDSNFNSSTGSLAGNPQIVSKSDSVTALTSSANPAVLGQSVTFTATITAVAPGSGTPTGTVTFLDGGSPIGTGPLSGGVATFTTTASALGIGNHPITTSYGGDSSFNGNTGTLTGTPQVVNKASSTTAVTSSANPAVLGQSVTFTATVSVVAPGSGTPSGTVTFLDGGISIGTGPLSSGVATLSTSALTLGNHTITTSYGGDSSFNASTGSLTGNPQAVGKPGSTTTLTSSRNPSALGQSVTFTATVSATPPGSGTPTGTVSFLDTGTSIGNVTLSAGVATLIISTLAAGNHTITASYGGDANFNGGVGSLTGNPQIVVGPPGIAKTFTPTVILPNGTTVLTITLTNPSANTVALAGAAFTDTFPANLVVATPNAIANTCGGTPVGAAGSSSVALTGGSIPVNGSCAVSVNVTSAANGSYVNTTGTVSSTNGGTGATASSTLSVASPPTISEVFGAAAIALSGSTSLTFTLANPAANSIPLTGVAFTDSLPSGLQIASPNGLTGTCGGGTITAAAGSSSVALSSATLPVSSSCTIAVNVTGTVLGVQNNSVTVTSSNGGTSNTSSASLNVVAPDFSVSMTAASESVKAGQPAAFMFTVGPVNGVAVPATVTLSISGLPPNSTASFQPASVMPGSTPITDTLVITTTPSVPYLTQNFGRDSSDSENASLHLWPSDAPFLRAGGTNFNPLLSVITCLLILGLSVSRLGRRKWLPVRATGMCLLLLLCVACGGMGIAGCASAQKLQTLGTPAGTYSVTVTATLATPRGNVQHSTTITLTVLP